MLEVTGLKVSYQGLKSVKGVSFTVGENEMIAMIGANGAGKTSILKVISGVQKEYEGKVCFQGKELKKEEIQDRVKRGILLVPEGREIFANLTVKENLIVGGHLKQEKIREKTDKLLKEFPVLYEFKDRLAGKLSGGQQQFVAIGRALMAEPKLLLVDEPTMGLTPKNSKMILEYLGTLPKKGISVLISSSQIQIKEENVKKILKLSQGKLEN